MRKYFIAAIGGTFLLAACSMTGSLKSKRAVQGAIESHLRGNPHISLQNFNTVVEKVTFKDDTADALAKFVSKESPQSAVEVRYHLKLDGREWKVVSSTPMGGQGAGSHMGMQGMGGMQGTGSQGGMMAPSQAAPSESPQKSH